ncbi:MAG: hypothetical protein GX130_02340 [Candidatus Hydrogenedens sp.]|jgi:hypothetical protein|nr:hypothetical protein [Candidatus Hydrogenedens sp.]
MNTSRSADEALERRILTLLRDGLSQRYATAHLRNYAEFDGFSDESLDRLRHFALRHIYPDWEERDFQIRVFKKTKALLASLSRLLKLSKATWKAFFRFGPRISQAAQAGLQLLDSFEATRKLEAQLFNHVKELGLEVRIMNEGISGLAPALAALSTAEYEAYLQGLTNLADLLTRPELLEAGESVLREIAQTMENQPDSYDEEEREGARYAVKVLAEGRSLFDSLPTELIASGVAAITKVEMDWLAQAAKED